MPGPAPTINATGFCINRTSKKIPEDHVLGRLGRSWATARNATCLYETIPPLLSP